MDIEDLAKLIRNIPDFPKPGIQFKDITTLLIKGEGFAEAVRHMVAHLSEMEFDAIVCVEARGFIFGAPVAYAMQKGLVIVRKPGKLPHKTKRVTYELEYGSDSLEIHEDAIIDGQRVVIIDDLLATGGTVAAVSKLLREMGAKILESAFVVELEGLNGRERLDGMEVFSLIRF
ncbi:adenine phosphoribosyltransferase [bacterium]|nr:adenine phosphoribosyltransferase [bacterium]